MKLLGPVLFAALACLASEAALAHKPSDSYLRLAGDQQGWRIEWEISLKDLEYVVGVDADGDARITWGELQARQREIVDYASGRLRIDADGTPAPLKFRRMQAARHSDGGYAVLEFDLDAPADAAQLALDYRLLFDVDPTHRGLILLRRGEAASTFVASADRPTIAIEAAQSHLLQALASFVREGVWHIWIGYDHILFLAALLLPAVYERRDAGWRPVASFQPTGAAVLKIVTMFTLAHSITLWLAVMDYVSLPSQWVEATIALSIVVTAANNLYPVLPLSGPAIAFGFGLIHGFGFAGVLTDLGLTQSTLAVSLLGFNIGVELGQLAIVVAFLPVAFLIRSSGFYRLLVFRGGSAAVILVGAAWAVERMFNVRLLGV